MRVKLRNWLAKHTFFSRLMIFLSVFGPGIVTGSVDNDAGGITTYSVAGAVYGFHMLWTLVPAFIVLFVVQEMNARMGLVTGKGLADLIRERFGVKVTFFIFIVMLIADLGNTATEFAGVAGSLSVFGISKYYTVPVAAIGVWVLVTRASYKTAERIFLVLSFALLSYVASAFLARPDWSAIGSAMVHPKINFDHSYVAMIIGLIGTTIAPWMQFYMQAAIIEKGLKADDYKYAIVDVLVGCVATVVVAFFIMVACATTLHPHGIHISEAADAAQALRPLAGRFAAELFAFGLFVASIFSATILPLSCAFTVCEAFGFEAGIDKSPQEAPAFYRLYTTIIVIGAAIILIPHAPLIKITIWTQVADGVLLPIVLVAMMRLVNDSEIMGKHINGRVTNFVGWATAIILSVLSLLLLVMPWW